MPAAQRVIISVVSDLVTDQRVHRTALSLHGKGLNVMLVGRKKHDSAEMDARPYATRRFRLRAEKGPLFYAFFNIRLFFYLLFTRADILVTNDLDTLLPNFLISKIKGCKLYYDSHEYFTEVPELVSRPRVRAIWLRIEKWIFPKLKNVFTVNDSIASIYHKKYNVDVKVVRNLPIRRHDSSPVLKREDFNLPTDKTIFLFQGAGINIDRGAEEAIEAVALLDRAALLFIGGGDVIEELKKKVADKNLSEKIFFLPRQPMDQLHRYSKLADIGLTLDKDTNLNYRYSLPNKIFDYIQAGLPILASNLPEVAKIVEEYAIGRMTPSHEPHALAEQMDAMMNNRQQLDLWRENLKLAGAELNWQNEELRLLEVFGYAIED